MKTVKYAKRLRIYVGSTDKFKHTPLYEVIVFAAKRYGILGASVMKGVMGFGSSKILSTTNFWDITEKLPMIVEIVDEEEKIEAFIEMISPYFKKNKNGGLITIEDVGIVT